MMLLKEILYIVSLSFLSFCTQCLALALLTPVTRDLYILQGFFCMQIHAKDIFFCFCIQVLACHTQYFASTFFHLMCLTSHHVSVFWSLSQCPTLCDLMDCSMPGSPVLHSQNLLKFLSIESVMLSYHLILCSLLLLLSSIFRSIRVFSNESTLHIRWPQYWSFSFGISPSNDYSGLLECRID